MGSITALALGAAPVRAQSDPAHEARADAVRQILTQLELVQLGPRVTTRELFADVPALRAAAEAVAWTAAGESPAARTAEGGTRVDVVVTGSAIQARLEEVAARIALPSRYRDVPFSFIGSRGQRYTATGRAGGAGSLPPVWARVAEEDRNLAVRAARLQALVVATSQLAGLAVRRRLDGATELQALVGESEWVRAFERELRNAGARDLQPPAFQDDGTVSVLVTLPAAALFAVLEGQRGTPVLSADTRAQLARGLAGMAGTGRGLGRVPGSAGGQRPRLLWAEASGLPAPGAQGPQVLISARKAAEQVARSRLMEKLRRVPFDERRTVGDLLRQRPDLESAAGRYIATNARELDSRAVNTDRWYIKLELNLDGLDAALR